MRVSELCGFVASCQAGRNKAASLDSLPLHRYVREFGNEAEERRTDLAAGMLPLEGSTGGKPVSVGEEFGAVQSRSGLRVRLLRPM